METALKEAGMCGRFQVYHVIFSQLPRFVSVWGIMIMMFGSYDPGWRCMSGGDMPTSRNYSVWQETSPGGIIGTSENGTGTGNIHNGSCDLMELCDSIEFNPGSVTIVSEFQLVCDRKWILRVILLVTSVGFLVGALAGGQIGEKFGRKISLYGGCLIMSVFSGLAIFSNSWVMYTVCLFFVGFGTHVAQSTSAIFSMEFLNSKWRSNVGSIPTWNLAMCCLTLTAAWMKSWVYLHLATCLISLAACVGYFILPESIRWLYVHGDSDAAEKGIHKMAKMNRRPSPMVETLAKLRQEYENCKKKRSEPLLDYSSSPSPSSSSSTSSTSTTYTFLHLFTDKTLLVLTIKFFTIFILSYTTYYALSFGVNSLPGNFYVNAVASSFCEISIVVLTGPMSNALGRRWGGCVVSLIGFVSCVGIVVALFAAEGDAQSTSIKACAFIARSGSMAIYHVGAVFMSELYPTVVRNVAFGFLTATSGLGGLVGPFLVPETGRDSFAVCFSIMSCCYMVSLAIFLSLPETNKLCLVDKIDGTREVRVTEDECV